MDSRKKTLLGIALVVCFVSLVVLGTFYYISPQSHEGLLELLYTYHTEFMLLIGLGGILVGALAYYLTNQEASEQKTIARKNTRVLLNLLDSDEKKIVEKLLVEKGADHATGLKSATAKRRAGSAWESKHQIKPEILEGWPTRRKIVIGKLQRVNEILF